MTKINQLAGLTDKQGIEEMEFTVVSLDRQNDGQYGKNYNCTVSDETGKTFCQFGAIKTHNVPGWVGKKLRLRSSKTQSGQLSIRVDKKGTYNNLYITNSVMVEVLGEGAATASPPSSQSQPQRQSLPDIPPHLLAKRLAEEWAAVYEWTHETFEKVLPEGTPCRECVTSVVISMNRMGVQILPPIEPPKKPWRDVVFKEIPLGSWEPERIRKAIIKLLQGAKVGQEIATALMEAANEPEFSPMNLFIQMITDAGVDDGDSDTVIKRDHPGLDMTNPADVRELIIKGVEFISECQKVAASKESVVDQIDV